MSLSITVTPDPGISENFVARFTDYVTAHPDDAREVLELPSGAALKVLLTEESGPVHLSEGDGGYQLRVSLARAQRTLDVLDIREMAHGTNFLPTLYTLGARGVLDALMAPAAVDEGLCVTDIARAHNPNAPERNLGYLYVALKLLALQGWLELTGRDRDTRARVTDLGRVAFRWWREKRSVFDLVHRSIGNHRRYRVHFRDPLCALEIVSEYRALVELMERGWELPGARDRTEARVARHLRKHLYGTVFTATAAALGMPRFEVQDDRQVATAPGLFSALQESGDVALADVVGDWSEDMLRLGIQVMVEHGAIARGEGDVLQLTERGQVMLAAGVHYYSALPMSYQTMHERVDDYYFGDPDPLDVANDGHVDRLMNIWGIGGAVSKGLAEVVGKKFLHQLFDNLPLAQQPAGIADMGCGSGVSLGRMAEYIIANTERGRHLAEYPLVVIGADFSEVSRQRTRSVLDGLKRHRGVVTAVVPGDVTDPDGYDQTIRALGIAVPAEPGEREDGSMDGARVVGAADLLHAMFHLTHERTVQVDSDERALKIIADGVSAAERVQLRRALATSMRREDVHLPDDDDALTALVASQFTTSFARRGRLLPALWAAADLVEFLHRWARYCTYGLLIAEAHSPRPSAFVETAPEGDGQWMRLEKVGHTCWSNQALSDQVPMPYVEHNLAVALAGLTEMDAKVYAENAVTLDLFTGCAKHTMERSLGWYRSRAKPPNDSADAGVQS